MKRLFAGIFILLSSAACLGQKQGVSGSIFWMEGNQMPGPGRINNKKGIAREIYFYKPVKAANQRRINSLYTEISGKLVAMTKSDSEGHFRIKLRPGKYSVFSKEEGGLFANLVDGDGFINTVDVKRNQFTHFVINVNYKAAF